MQIYIESDIIGESVREILNNLILSQQDDRHRGTGLFCLVQEPQHIYVLDVKMEMTKDQSVTYSYLTTSVS